MRNVDNTLASYDWEKAIDTSTTWRIGDGTAAFIIISIIKLQGSLSMTPSGAINP